MIRERHLKFQKYLIWIHIWSEEWSCSTVTCLWVWVPSQRIWKTARSALQWTIEGLTSALRGDVCCSVWGLECGMDKWKCLSPVLKWQQQHEDFSIFDRWWRQQVWGPNWACLQSRSCHCVQKYLSDSVLQCVALSEFSNCLDLAGIRWAGRQRAEKPSAFTGDLDLGFLPADEDHLYDS